jgi:ATP-dependent helicase/nuclease subunit A
MSDRLPFDEPADTAEGRIDARDRAGRERAVDPRFNVVLEASAGTGKTRVLVDRYVNLLRAGVDPSEILALTFTRKAAAEMHERVVLTLRDAAGRGDIPLARWRELRDRTADLAISTIDAFCLSLLREFPLEADLDPGFRVADDTEIPRLVDESLDRTLRICRSLARRDEEVALVFAQLGDRRARSGLASLLNRRIVVPAMLGRYVSRARSDLSVATAARQGATALVGVVEAMRGGLDRFVETGPLHPSFDLFSRRLRALAEAVHASADPDPALVQTTFASAREHFLTKGGHPRKRLPSTFPKGTFASESDWQAHRRLVTGHASDLAEAWLAYRRDLNALVSRGVWRMFRIAEAEYRSTLDGRALVDFSDLLIKTLDLLRQMEEFAQSRFRLESRYHHVLVDEFQDTSRAQWDLVSLLVRAWGEGAGLAHTGPLPPSIFIVGDRKQSIYAFRDADVALFGEASRHIQGLRAEGDVRYTISRSHRAVPRLLAFVNDVCEEVPKVPGRRDGFVYEERDRFPLASSTEAATGGALSIVTGETVEECARSTAAEIDRLVSEGAVVRDRETGLHRPVRIGDIAILFRTRDSHRDYEQALEARGLPAYVYKGLGFFEADEVKDVLALLRFLVEPASDLRAAAWLRSRFVRLSDEGLRRLGPAVAASLGPAAPAAALDPDDDEALWLARQASSRWLAFVDRIPPAELLDRVLNESAYSAELQGPRLTQARENLKKLRATVRRIQNRGYATLARITAHLDRLSLGEEANAVIDASDAVSLMTVHASKGLEFPVVFLVNLWRGTGGGQEPIRVAASDDDDVMVAVGDFQAGTTEEEAAKDREEAKRLLYVALTRARDHLYMGTVVRQGRLHASSGSLAEVLPASLRQAFEAASSGVELVGWAGPSGTVHRIQVVGPAREVSSTRVGRLPATGDRRPADTQVLVDEEVLRIPVTSLVEEPRRADAARGIGSESNQLVGTMVHRLVERAGLDTGRDESSLAEMARSILRTPPGVDVDHPEVLITEMLSVYRTLAGRADIQGLFKSGEVLHEVPFCAVIDGRLVRGSIDCLIRSAADRFTVLEFKTGRPRSEHEHQADLYRRAVEALFPGAVVEGRLVYASHPPSAR